MKFWVAVLTFTMLLVGVDRFVGAPADQELHSLEGGDGFPPPPPCCG